LVTRASDIPRIAERAIEDHAERFLVREPRVDVTPDVLDRLTVAREQLC
jgi:hypothetical protein